MGALFAPAADGLVVAAGVAAVGAAVAGVGTGAAGVGAAALALGVAAAFSAGFAPALAAGAAAAAGAALALLAGVCAWTADANDIIPATADNQKALLRRITTLNLCGEETRHRWLSSPRRQDSSVERSPKLRLASSSARAFPPSRIFTLLREVARTRGM
jgi:hypothetical protein